jgi:hypothetical protein
MIADVVIRSLGAGNGGFVVVSHCRTLLVGGDNSWTAALSGSGWLALASTLPVPVVRRHDETIDRIQLGSCAGAVLFFKDCVEFGY